jgi:hypothetical protein
MNPPNVVKMRMLVDSAAGIELYYEAGFVLLTADNRQHSVEKCETGVN